MAEAIQWANRGQPILVSVVKGRKTVERIPQTGTFGDYDSAREGPKRYRRVIDIYGHDVRIPLTNGAADLDTDGSYARHQRQKWKTLGWYEAGDCPVAKFISGEMTEDHIVSPEVLAEAHANKACRPGTYNNTNRCPHSLDEERARKAQNAADNAERMKNFRTDAEKIIAAQTQGNAQVVEGIAATLASAVKDMATTITSAQTSPPARDKAK